MPIKCKYLSNISDEWISEKLNCINSNQRMRGDGIQDNFKSKHEKHNPCFTVEEFADILRFKGSARNVRLFKEEYKDRGEVEKVSSNLFTSKLNKWSFKDTDNASSKKQILDEIQRLFDCLPTLKWVEGPIASACLALCFPELCCTADYIVPAMLHNEYDDRHTQNPLFTDATNKAKIVQALRLPVSNNQTPDDTRELATCNYRDYIQEFWGIKQTFGLSNSIQQIESALWSFGKCYCQRQTDRNSEGQKRYYDNKPLFFSTSQDSPSVISPDPPRHGLFSKSCPNISRPWLS